MKGPDYNTHLSEIAGLSATERAKLEPVANRFAFRSNTYYGSLINWSDPQDPLRRVVIPSADELREWGTLDASDEQSYIRAPGLEHKYADTALLLVTDVCAAYCRFCFRKRLFISDNNEATQDISQGLEYIRRHPEITNVLLSGGDPLVLSTPKLADILGRLAEIDHVRIIRIGTKMPAFNPQRLQDPDLLRLIESHNNGATRIYIMSQFNHPRELTSLAIQGVKQIQRVGASILNQTPLIRGVNDRIEMLGELLEQLACLGVSPYYVFQCRPTSGNQPYSVPLEEAYSIFQAALLNRSGLAGHARFVMSHRTGKIQVVGLTDHHVLMRYHRAVHAADHGRLLLFARNAEAHWLDDYQVAAGWRSARSLDGCEF